MNAPDKIYLPEEPDVFFQVEYDKDLYPVEYIRKDVLLDWAKEKDLSSVLHHPDRHYILMELIEKIESL